MPAVRLPLPPGETPQVEGAMAEQLSGLLAPVNDPSMQARLGDEQIAHHGVDAQGTWQVTQGERFSQRNGWVQGRRYLRLDGDGQAMAVANVTLRRQGRRIEARLSNIFVAPDHRRQGWASRLVQQVQADFPALVCDSCFSEAGAALVGHTGATPSSSIATKRRRGP